MLSQVSQWMWQTCSKKKISDGISSNVHFQVYVICKKMYQECWGGWDQLLCRGLKTWTSTIFRKRSNHADACPMAYNKSLSQGTTIVDDPEIVERNWSRYDTAVLENQKDLWYITVILSQSRQLMRQTHSKKEKIRWTKFKCTTFTGICGLLILLSGMMRRVRSISIDVLGSKWDLCNLWLS